MRNSTLVHWLFALTVPFVLVTGIIWSMIAWDGFLQFEYSRPGMTPDGYRFMPDDLRMLRLWDAEERYTYGLQTQRWLREGRPGADLAALRTRTGEPLYRLDEVNHMVDVQVFVRVLTVVLAGGLLILIGGGFVLARRAGALGRAISAGGIATWVIFGVLSLLLIGGVSSDAWSVLFVGFHQVFFPQGNWQFFYTDTLIRLFPEQLWFDFFVIIFGGSLAIAALMAVLGRRLR